MTVLKPKLVAYMRKVAGQTSTAYKIDFLVERCNSVKKLLFCTFLMACSLSFAQAVSPLFENMLKGGSVAALRSLIRAGENTNARNSNGKTPLMYAAENGSIQKIKILIEASADAELTDAKGQTAIALAFDNKTRIAIREALWEPATTTKKQRKTLAPVVESKPYKAYDVFYFGMNSKEIRAIAEKNGYELGIFANTRDWCVEMWLHCSVDKGENFIYFKFDKNWQSMYSIEIESYNADLVKSLLVRFGDPESVEEQSSSSAFATDDHVVAVNCTNTLSSASLSVKCSSSVVPEVVTSTEYYTEYRWVIDGKILYEAFKGKEESDGLSYYTGPSVRVTHTELAKKAKLVLENSMSRAKQAEEEKKRKATEDASGAW